MPQLNTSPWFMILIFSWLVFLTLLPTKIMSHTSPNKTISETKEMITNNPWTWPW